MQQLVGHGLRDSPAFALSAVGTVETYDRECVKRR